MKNYYLLTVLMLSTFSSLSHGFWWKTDVATRVKRLRCRMSKCPSTECEPDEYPVIPDGQCCSKCEPHQPHEEPNVPDCSAVSCFACEGEIPDGECCPICDIEGELVNCSAVLCIFCEGEIPVGQCCPICDEKEEPPMNCDSVELACNPECDGDVPEGECCPSCENEEHPLDCNLVDCNPACHGDIPEGGCCPSCDDEDPSDKGGYNADCSAVSCVACEGVVPEGECCPNCEEQPPLDCSLVRCRTQFCTYGYELVRDGCCSTCQLRDNCQIVQCVTSPCPPICDDDKEGSDP